MNDWATPLLLLLDLQRRFERGPKREGAFAVWLTVRTALDLAVPDAATATADRRRLELLTHRLAPLAVPRSLARGLTTALSHLNELSPGSARIALTQLVAPTRDSLGPEAADAVGMAVGILSERRER